MTTQQQINKTVPISSMQEVLPQSNFFVPAVAFDEVAEVWRPYRINVGELSKGLAGPFYVVPAGSGDRTAEIQAAVNFGKVVMFEPDVYNTSAAINIPSNTTIIGSAGVTIQMTVPSMQIFHADSKENIQIIGNGMELIGEGTYGGNPGGPWVGNGHLERGIELSTCSKIHIEGIWFKNFGNAGVSIFGGSKINITGCIIEGTNNYSTPILYLGNFQFGILVESYPSVSGGVVDDIRISNVDISGTAQGMYFGGSVPGAFGSLVNRAVLLDQINIHDIPGQHAVYDNLGWLSATNINVNNVALDAFKVQVAESGIDVGGITVSGLVADNIGGHVFVAAHLVGFAGSLNDISVQAVGRNVGRGIGVVDNIHNFNGDILVDGCSGEAVYIAGDNLSDINITMKAKNVALDGLLITATNATNIHVRPIILEPNTSNTGRYGVIVASASADVQLSDPIVSDAAGRMVYGVVNSVLGSSINVDGTAVIAGAASYAISATGVVNWAVTREFLSGTLGKINPAAVNLVRFSIGTVEIPIPHVYLGTNNCTVEWGPVVAKVQSGVWSVTGASSYSFDGTLQPLVNGVGSIGSARGWASLGLGNASLGGITTITSPATATNYALSTPAVSDTLLARSDAATVTNKGINAANNTITNLATSMFAANVVDNDSTLAANSATRLPTQAAVKAYADNLVVGLLDDRGNFSAAGNVFPSTGGSGSAGAILKGDIWVISVAGTLGGADVNIGDQVRAIVNTPGQTAGNWAISEANIGYVPENVANKDTDGTLAANSDTKYPSQKAVKTYSDTTKISTSLLTTRGDIITRGAAAPQRVAMGASNTVVASDGTDTVFRTLTTLLDGAFGSTRGMALVRGAANWSALALGAANRVLRSDGTDALWALVNAATDLTGATPIANGGTGQATAALAFTALKQDATSGATGVVQLATAAEILAGTDAVKAITPLILKQFVQFADFASIANGGTGQLPVGAGIWFVIENTTTGEIGAYLVGGGTSTYLFQVNTSTGIYVQGTPGGGKASVVQSGGNYFISNNLGGAKGFSAVQLKVRQTN